MDDYTALENFHYFEDNVPGGKTAVSVLYAHGAMKPGVIKFLRDHDIKGVKLWILYKNVCSQDDDEFVDLVYELTSSNNLNDVVYYSRLEGKLLRVIMYLESFGR